jgi:hypothetical protein
MMLNQWDPLGLLTAKSRRMNSYSEGRGLNSTAILAALCAIYYLLLAVYGVRRVVGYALGWVYRHYRTQSPTVP